MNKKHTFFLIKLNEKFRKFANRISNFTGSPIAFSAAVLLIVVWLLLGPYYKWSSDWSLFINSSTTVITFLMVFIIQSSQNRDTRVIQTKLNAILAALEGANNQLIDIENDTDEVVNALSDEIKQLKD